MLVDIYPQKHLNQNNLLLRIKSTKANIIFAKNHSEKDPSRVYYDFLINPQPHELVCVQLGCGYEKEMREPHWCYVPRVWQKLTVIPLTSIKSNSGPAGTPFEFDIVEDYGVKGRMRIKWMRRV